MFRFKPLDVIQLIKPLYTTFELLFKESFSVSKSEVSIPLSRASAIYYRGMQKLREKSRRIAEKKQAEEEKEMSEKIPRKKYSISKGIGIYERGLCLKAELERKRKEESKKKKWR